MDRYRIPARLEDWPEWLSANWLRLNERIGTKMHKGGRKDRKDVFEKLLGFLSVLARMLSRVDKMLQMRSGPEVLSEVRANAIEVIHKILCEVTYLRQKEVRQEFYLFLMTQKRINDYVVRLDDYLQALLNLAKATSSPIGSDLASVNPQARHRSYSILSQESCSLRSVRALLRRCLEKLAHKLPVGLPLVCRRKLRGCLKVALDEVVGAEDAHGMTLLEARLEIQKAKELMHQLDGLQGPEFAVQAGRRLEELFALRSIIQSVYGRFMTDIGGYAKGTLIRLDAWIQVSETALALRQCSCELRQYRQVRKDVMTRKNAEASRNEKELARRIVKRAEQMNPKGFPKAVKTLHGVVRGLRRRYGL